MKLPFTFRLPIITALVMLASVTVFSQTTAFTYQGRLTDGSAPANGTYEMEFKLYDAVAGGAQVGSTVTNSSVSVVGGIFVVTLDFGAAPFSAGADRWLDVGVRKASDPPGFTALTPRQAVLSQPFSIKSGGSTSADTLSAACVGCVDDVKISDVAPSKINAPVPLTKGGTGAVTAAGARTSLGLGTLSTVTPTGTANTTTFLRGDNTWSTPAFTLGSGTAGFLTRWTVAGTVIGDSLLLDNGTGVGVGTAPDSRYLFFASRVQQTVTGDGQATIYGFRDRNNQNDGTGYGQNGLNSAVKGLNFWGDVYSAGVAGFSYNDLSRTGGVIGAEVNGVYWGSLGYKSGALTTFGVYGSNAYGSGPGLTTEKQGVGGGFFGGFAGSVSRGGVVGQITTGDQFASYNVGNVYTSGFTADIVSLKGANAAGSERAPAFAVTSPSLKVYDNGSAFIDGTEVFVPFSKSYSGMLSAAPDVTVTAVGSPAQLYIKSISDEGFTVAVASGKATVKFSWIAVGNRVDSAKTEAVPTQIRSESFDQQVKDFMFDDSNKNESGKPLWWDGDEFRSDKAPEAPKTVKIENQPE